MNERDSGHQGEKWRVFYEQLWQQRLDLISGMIEAGESNLFRLVRRLDAIERHFELVHSTSDGKSYFRIPHPSGPQLPTGQAETRPAAVAGETIRIPAYTASDHCAFLYDYLDSSGPYDAIIELGCGYGRNLFTLYEYGAPQDIAYFGGELSSSGVTLGKRLAALDPRLQATFFPFDFLHPDFSPLPPLERVFVFTLHAIEQVERLPFTVIPALCAIAKEVTCVHLEPFGFQIDATGSLVTAHRKMIQAMGWNQNLVQRIQSLADKGLLTITYMRPDLFVSNDALNMTSVMIWKKNTFPVP